MCPRKKIVKAGKTAIANHVARVASVRQQPEEKAEKTSLSRENILAAAMAIIDSSGIEALSMRRLGKELGVNPMAVYYHIPNKMALLDALVEMVMSSIDLTLDDPGLAPEKRLLNAAYIYRRALLAHPSLIPAAANRAPRTAASLRPVEVLVTIFVDAGFNHEDAFSSMNVLAAYVRGAVVREAAEATASGEDCEEENRIPQLSLMLPPEEFPNLVKVDTASKCLDSEATFDLGARALIRGLLETYGNKEE